MSAYERFNLIEAIVWITSAFISLILIKRMAVLAENRASARLTPVIFLLFFLIDIVEANLRVAWLPITVTIFKAFCLILIAMNWSDFWRNIVHVSESLPESHIAACSLRARIDRLSWRQLYCAIALFAFSLISLGWLFEIKLPIETEMFGMLAALGFITALSSAVFTVSIISIFGPFKGLLARILWALALALLSLLVMTVPSFCIVR
jgi:hypothetical protein